MKRSVLGVQILALSLWVGCSTTTLEPDANVSSAAPPPRAPRTRIAAHPKASQPQLPPEVRRKAPRFDPRAARPLTSEAFTTLPSTNHIAPSLLTPPTTLFTLGPGDVVEIELLTVPGTRSQALVGPDGKIYFFLLPGLNVWGLNLDETRQLLERELRKYLRTEPQVSITLKNIASKRIWMLGRLNRPGVYPLGAPMTLLEAVAMAGGAMTSGALDMADLRNSFVTRGGTMLPIDFERLLRHGDRSQNIYLQADDFIYLPSASNQDIHVLGSVRTPMTVPFRRQVTLLAALASAGGPGPGASLARVAIVRGSLSEPRIAIVNISQIIRGKAPDVLLEPRDIIYVPSSRYQLLGRYMSMIVSSFIRTVAINEGIRAVDPEGGSVGISTTPQ